MRLWPGSRSGRRSRVEDGALPETDRAERGLDEDGHPSEPSGASSAPEASGSSSTSHAEGASRTDTGGTRHSEDREDTEDTVELHLATVGGPGAVRSGAPAVDPSHGSRAGGRADAHAHSSGSNPTGTVGTVGGGSTGSAGGNGDDDPHDGPVPGSTGATVADDESVRAARRRFVRRRWARRWLAWRRLMAAVLLLALVAGSVWLVFFSSVLAVNGVRVEGTDALTSDAVRRVAEVPTGTPLATVDLDSVTDRVERLPAVTSDDVSRAWPDRVRIDVTERQVVAVVAPTTPGERFRGTDEQGVVFRSFARQPPALPLIRMGEGTGAAALAEAAAVSGSLPAAIAKRVAEVRVRTVDTISLSLRDGRTVRWGSVDGSADKARVLAVLLGQQASFIDVSVPGRPVIRR